MRETIIAHINEVRTEGRTVVNNTQTTLKHLYLRFSMCLLETEREREGVGGGERERGEPY